MGVTWAHPPWAPAFTCTPQQEAAARVGRSPAPGMKRCHWDGRSRVPGSFVFQVVPFLPLFFVSWGPGTFPRPSPCRNHQIWSPSYEPGRLPAGQRLQNSWRLLTVSERCTAPPDLGAEGNYHSSFSFFSFSFFPRPFKFVVVVVVS